MRLYDQAAVASLNQLGDRLRDDLTAALKEAGLRGCVSGLGSLLQLHWQDRQPANATDSMVAMTRAGELPRLLHLELMNRGVYAARRGMFCLSTPMTPGDIDNAIVSFRESLSKLKPYIADTTPHLLVD
jgi:glutamate-1-semialdehyde 2,1-aminomutase